jgi:putative ABC transport system permease protein
LKVAGIAVQYAGSSSYVSIGQITRIIGRRNMFNALMIRLDKRYESDLEDRLEQMNTSGVILERKQQEKQADNVMGNMVFFTLIITVSAIILGLSIVYNTSVMSFGERQRELATLRVIGISNTGVSMIMLNELILELMLGIALGLPFGRLLGGFYIRSLNTDSFIYPEALQPRTYLFAALAALLCSLAGHILAVLRLRRLDLIEVLKERD